MKKTHRWETYRDRKRQHRWRLREIRSGKIIANGAGDGYHRRGDMDKQIKKTLNLTFDVCDFTETR